jgi:hypothetical protein
MELPIYIVAARFIGQFSYKNMETHFHIVLKHTVTLLWFSFSSGMSRKTSFISAVARTTYFPNAN